MIIIVVKKLVNLKAEAKFNFLRIIRLPDENNKDYQYSTSPEKIQQQF